MTYEVEKLFRLLEIPAFQNLLVLFVAFVFALIFLFLVVLWSKN